MNQFFCSRKDNFALTNLSLRFSNNRTLYFYGVISIILLLSACNSGPKASDTIAKNDSSLIQLPAPTLLDKAEIERLRIACEAWYDSVLKRTGFNGGMVVAKKGTIVFEAYNNGSNATGTNLVTDSSSFHIASVSKTFTAMAVLKLWQDGKLGIDDEFSKYFPTFDFPGVTVRTLLNHRSGLPNYVHFMENMGWNKKVNITNQDVFDFLITRKAEMKDIAPPNTRFTYCNTNFALLALLIEKVSGKYYGDYLQQTFFSPLQMNHTFVYNNKTDSGKVLLSHDARGRIISLNFLDFVYGDKNVYSTPRDLLTWDKALTSGKLFTQKTLTEAYTPYSNEKPGVRNYGLGWRMNNYPTGKKMIYHNGWWHGNNAAFIRLLQDSATIVVLGNKENHGIYHAKDLASLFGNYFGDSEEEEAETTKTAVRTIKNPPASNKHRLVIKDKKTSGKNTTSKTGHGQNTQPMAKARKP